MKKFISKNNIVVTVMIAIAIIALLFGIAKYFYAVNHLVSYSFSAEDIAGYTPESTDDEKCISGTIDESYVENLYDFVPNLYLEEGYYRYTVDYICEGAAGAFLWPHSFIGNYGALDQRTVVCEEGEHHAENEYWQNLNLNMTLRLYYKGVGRITVTGYTIEQTSLYATRELMYTVVFALVLTGLACAVYYFKKNGITNSTKLVIGGITVLTLASSLGALLPWAYEGNDFMFHLARIQGIAEGLRNGQLPVLINPTFYNGYGYADTIMYGNVLLYFPAILVMYGVKLTSAYNVYIIFINVLTAMISYFSFKGMFKDKTIAFVTTAIYVLAPYRMINIYMRSAVGEFSALAFLPLIVYGMFRIYTDNLDDKKNRFNILPLAIGISGLIQTHILSVEMAGFFIIFTCIILVKLTIRPKRLIRLLATVGCVLVLNLGFIVPFVDYYLHADMVVNARETDGLIQNSGAYFIQLFNLVPQSGWKSIDAGSIQGEMPLALGCGIGLCMVACAVSLVIKKEGEDSAAFENAQKSVKIIGLVSLIVAVLSTFMATVYCPWDYVASVLRFTKGIIGSVQFTWRWLEIATISGSVAGACGLILLKNYTNTNLMGLAAGIIILLNFITMSFLYSSMIEGHRIREMDDIYEAGYDTASMVSGAEYTPANSSWTDVTEVFYPRPEDGLTVTAYGKKGTDITIELKNETDTDKTVLLPLLYYKGYSAKDAGGALSSSNIVCSKEKDVALVVPAGFEGKVNVWFNGLWYWRVAEIISLISVIGVVALGIKRKMTKKKAE